MAVVSAVAAVVGGVVGALLDTIVGHGRTGSLVTLLVGTVVIGVTTLAGLVVARVPEVREPLTAVRARFGRG
jgi:putative peptidoglycan lipid II flippase